MKFQRIFVIAMAAAVLTLGGCTGGREDEAGPLPPVEIPTLTPESQPFRTGTAFANGVLSVDVPTPDGGTRTLDTVRHIDELLPWNRDGAPPRDLATPAGAFAIRSRPTGRSPHDLDMLSLSH